jgi:hypothetical protein
LQSGKGRLGQAAILFLELHHHQDIKKRHRPGDQGRPANEKTNQVLGLLNQYA